MRRPWQRWVAWLRGPGAGLVDVLHAAVVVWLVVLALLEATTILVAWSFFDPAHLVGETVVWGVRTVGYALAAWGLGRRTRWGVVAAVGMTAQLLVLFAVFETAIYAVQQQDRHGFARWVLAVLVVVVGPAVWRGPIPTRESGLSAVDRPSGAR